jgi:hypothetical protein
MRSISALGGIGSDPERAPADGPDLAKCAVDGGLVAAVDDYARAVSG